MKCLLQALISRRLVGQLVVPFWVSADSLRYGVQLENIGHVDVPLEDTLSQLFTVLLFCFLAAHCFHRGALLHYRPIEIEQTDNRLNPLKLWYKINPSSLIKKILFFICVCALTHVHVHTSIDVRALGGQKRILYPLELKLQACVNHPT